MYLYSSDGWHHICRCKMKLYQCFPFWGCSCQPSADKVSMKLPSICLKSGVSYMSKSSPDLSKPNSNLSDLLRDSPVADTALNVPLGQPKKPPVLSIWSLISSICVLRRIGETTLVRWAVPQCKQKFALSGKWVPQFIQYIIVFHAFSNDMNKLVLTMNRNV